MNITFNIEAAKSALNQISVSRFNELTGERLTVKGWCDAVNGARAAIGQLGATSGDSRLSGARAVKPRGESEEIGYKVRGSVSFTLETTTASAPLLFDALVATMVQADKASLASGYAGYKLGVPSFRLNGKLADWVAKFESAPVAQHDVTTGGEQMSVTADAPAIAAVEPATVQASAPVKRSVKRSSVLV